MKVHNDPKAGSPELSHDDGSMKSPQGSQNPLLGPMSLLQNIPPSQNLEAPSQTGRS